MKNEGELDVDHFHSTVGDLTVVTVRCISGRIHRGDFLSPAAVSPLWELAIESIVKYGREWEFIDQAHRAELYLRGSDTYRVGQGQRLYAFSQ
ncbi:hypothetical protein GCM10011591_05980 [Nocardia camponoti]|uniref:Uncharacterized protein n=1 Tax=Nocardia camponoti TaxID=1616106 RepID=A0A917Q8Z3_9NOCA|nr:hypothetical protein GCM10011591_05980 [Nocardia camponoti]